MDPYYFEDFTETEYCRLLRLAKSNWRLIEYKDYQQPGKVCLWRHDVDFSIHRALRLAQIEAEEQISATYFIHLHSEFYNPFEADNARLIHKILALGHTLGLHFDPSFYVECLQTNQQILTYLKFEQQILAKIFQTKIDIFSLHNPDIGNWLDTINQTEVEGLINTYGQYFRDNYGYCSDSNGYWRFRRLRQVLETADDERLQVLTHPVWWVPEPMSPRQRINRCIEGRAAHTGANYDRLLALNNRENIK